MKTARILLALLVLTVAGVAWAAQPAPATSPEAPAAPNAELNAPAQNGALVNIDGLFIEPAETGACCRANCLEERVACNDACAGEPGCFSACYDQYLSCVSFCN